MRRFRFMAAVGLMMLSVLVITSRGGTGAGAQDATTEGHALVGAWLADIDTADPANTPSLFIFASDGAFWQTNADGSSGYGVWRATSDATADLTLYFLAGDSDGGYGGMTVVRAAVAVSADGMSFTAPYTIEVIDPTGAASGQAGPGEAAGTKIAVEPMGVPVMTINDLFGGDQGSSDDDLQIEGTPVAVTLNESTVTTSMPVLKAGETYTFVVTNVGKIAHEMVIEKAGDNDVPLEMGGKELELEDVAPGTSKSLTMSFDTPGKYQLACHIPKHFEAGMVVEFDVSE